MKEQIEKAKECSGNCGMNYCDDNGCIDRKRNLVGDPIPPETTQSPNTGIEWIKINSDGKNLPDYNNGKQYKGLSELGNIVDFNGANALINAFKFSDITHFVEFETNFKCPECSDEIDAQTLKNFGRCFRCEYSDKDIVESNSQLSKNAPENKETFDKVNEAFEKKMFSNIKETVEEAAEKYAETHAENFDYRTGDNKISRFSDRNKLEDCFEAGYYLGQFQSAELTKLREALDGLVTDVGNLLGEYDIEWQQAGYYEHAKELLSTLKQ